MNLKIKYILVTIVSLITIESYAQAWLSKLPQNKSVDSLNFYDYKKAFNDYWEPYNVEGGWFIDNVGNRRKASGWKQFKRQEEYWEKRINTITGKFPTVTAWQQYKNWQLTNTRNITSSSGNWQSVGPSNVDLSDRGTGRINCISFNPTNTNHYWVGAPAGGLWETTDNGVSWAVLTDDNPVLGVSDICLAQDYDSTTNPTIFIATGDKDGGSFWGQNGGQSNDNESVGVLKSTDAGATWSATGLSFSVSSHITIGRLIAHPSNNTTLWAATSDGIYKTTDGGVSWTQKQTGSFIDMELKPSDPTTIYASTSVFSLDTHPQIFRSTDSGETWTVIQTWTIDEIRCELAVSSDNPTIVYAAVSRSDYNGSYTNYGGLEGIYRSQNSGASFTQVYDGTASNHNLFGWKTDKSDAGGQGDYDLAFEANPTDVNELYIGGVNAYKSSNANSSNPISFAAVSCWTSSTYYNKTSSPVVHADHHMAKYRSDGVLFDTNDGGVHYTTNGGSSWTDRTPGLVNGQLYGIGVAQSVFGEVVGGFQDNGTKLLRTGNTNWTDVKGGDGMNCAIDMNDNDNQYGTYVRGQIDRTTNNWGSSSSIRSAGNADWAAPLEIDPAGGTTLYFGDEYVRYYDGSWHTLSSSLSPSADDYLQTLSVYHVGGDLVIYTGDKDQIWKSNTSGGSYSDITSNLPTGNTITDIEIDYNDYNHAWVTFGGYDGNRVYETTNAGGSWTNISTGLPSLPSMTIVQNDQNTTDDELYIGTDVGIYVKIGLGNWQAFNDGLPNVVISDLEIYYDATPENSILYAGTFGRGVWKSDVYTAPSGPMTYVSSTTTQDNTSVTYQGNIDQEIIGVEIVTSGNESPLDVTSFTFNTNGSTDATGDLDNTRLYFTGSSAVFNTSNQFGSTTANPNGTFMLTGTQALSSGTNHFWLVYDIDAVATIGNLVDAECTSLTVDSSVKTPDITAPVGSREIASCVLCYSWGNTDYATSTTRVLFNTIDNTSAKPIDGSGNAYSDYTNQSTSIAINQSYDLTVQVNTDGNYTVGTKVWIDWNQDCDFDDANEEYDLGTANNVADATTSNSPLSVSVPLSAKLGNTTMRVSTKYNSYATNCETDFDGETEDYTVTIINCESANQTVWDGGWSNGTPDASKPVVIAGNYNSTTNFTCCELTINNGAILTIKANEYIQIEHDFVNNGTIDILHQGSLVQIDDEATVSGSGTFNVHKTTTPYVEHDFTYWSSPITDETIANVFVANPANRIFELVTANFDDQWNGAHPQTTGSPDSFDDNGDDWQIASGIMTPGKGYITEGPTGTTSQTVIFTTNTGALNTGTISYAVTLDANASDNFDNQNLIGNPYPSGIVAATFLTENSGVLGGTLYFWTHNTAIAAGGGPEAYNFTNNDYATYVSGTGGVIANSGGIIPTEVIASGQGFLADVTSAGNVVFENHMRTSTGNTNFYRMLNTEADRFWLNMTNDEGVFRQILIGFFDEATENHDRDYDAKRLFSGNNFDFSSLLEDTEYAIQGLPTFSNDKVIALAVKTSEIGLLKISLDHYEGIFNTQGIYLIDYETQIVHDLKENDYEFTTTIIGTVNDRFELRFTNESLSIDEHYIDGLVIFPNPSNDIFTVKWNGNLKATIKVYDVSGRLMSNESVNTNPYQIDLSDCTIGIYFVKINIDGKQIVKKLVLR